MKKPIEKVAIARDKFNAKLIRMLLKSRREVENIYLNKDVPMIESIISGILIKSRDQACIDSFGFILDKVLAESAEPVSNEVVFSVQMNEDGRFETLRPKLKSVK